VFSRGDAVPTGSVSTLTVEVRIARYQSRPGSVQIAANDRSGEHDGMRACQSLTDSAVPTGPVNTQFEEFLCRRRLSSIVKVREKR
jgi:hypothetical protein